MKILKPSDIPQISKCPRAWAFNYSDKVKLGKAIHEEAERFFIREECTAIGVGGQHSDEYFDDGACEWCGLKRFGLK